MHLLLLHVLPLISVYQTKYRNVIDYTYEHNKINRKAIIRN